MSEFNISIPGGESKRLKTGGKYCPADILVTAEGSAMPDGNFTDPDYIYAVTRPKDWLAMPTPGDDEVYCLCLIPPGTDGAFTANLTFSGSCSVEFGNLVNGVFAAKETITPVTNTRFFHTVKAEDYGDITGDGYKQYLVRITGTIPRMEVNVETYDAYRYGVPYLTDIAIGLKTNILFGSQTTSIGCPYLRYVRFVGNGQLKNADGQNFRGCVSLMAVSSQQKATGIYYSYMFEKCRSLLALSPNIFISNVGYRGAFIQARPVAVQGLEVMPTNAGSMFDGSNGLSRFDGNQINTVNCQNFDSFAYNSTISEFDNLNISSLTDAGGMFGLCRVTRLTFAGDTTPGGWTIDISNSVMSHKALLEMINSLPTATTTATITITNNPGAAELTDEEIAVATAKNWTVTI